MHPVLYHIAAVFLLLLFSLKDASVCLYDCKQMVVMTASAEDELPEPPGKKSNGEKGFQYEFVPLYHHAGSIAPMLVTATINRMHWRFAFCSDVFSVVLTPPPEVS